MAILTSLTKPSYIYAIICDELDLIYIGIRKERDFYDDDSYWSSSVLCHALRKEFSDKTWHKDLIQPTETFEEAHRLETDFINVMRATRPTHLINLSANDETKFWEFIPTHLDADNFKRARDTAIRTSTRPIIDGALMNICLVKKPDGTAHAPFILDRDLTPIPKYGNWPAEQLAVYYALPPGFYHFCAVIGFRESKNEDEPKQKRYKVIGLLEEFESERACRIISSRVSNRGFDYESYVEEVLAQG